MRIVLVGINYAPEHTGIAPYTTQLAESLAKKHSVTVLTALPHYPSWRVAPGWRRHRTVVRSQHGVQVHHLPLFVPRKQDAVRRAVYEASWAVRVAHGLRRIQADLVLAVVPALMGSYVAVRWARRKNIPVGVIVQDIMSAASAQGGVTGGQAVAARVESLERRVIQCASGVVTIHPAMADSLASRFALGATPSTIYNWSHVVAPSSSAASSLRAELGWADRYVVLHSGNMGAKQNLVAVAQAAAQADAENLDVLFALVGGGSEFEKLSRIANTLKTLEVLPGVADEIFPSLLGAANILLVNERPGMRDMSLPSKLTSYFAAGKPILAATDMASATGKFLHDNDAGVIVRPSDGNALLAGVVALRDNEPLRQRQVENARNAMESLLRPDVGLDAYNRWVQQLYDNR